MSLWRSFFINCAGHLVDPCNLESDHFHLRKQNILSISNSLFLFSEVSLKNKNHSNVHQLDKQINEMWNSHTMQHYPAITRKHWDMRPRGWILTTSCNTREARHKGHVLYDSFIWKVLNRQVHWSRKQVSSRQGLEEERMGSHWYGSEVLFWDEENVLELDSGEGCTTSWM